ncbi:uncharacterized protein LOC144704475 isoform X2 [Wolffia australiana]
MAGDLMKDFGHCHGSTQALYNIHPPFVFPWPISLVLSKSLQMEGGAKRRSISPFGSWNYGDEGYAGGRNTPTLPARTPRRREARIAGSVERTSQYSYAREGGNFRVHDHQFAFSPLQERRTPTTNQKATPEKTKKPSKKKNVDEDLYEVPPELLYEKPRRKSSTISELWRSCLCLNNGS